MGCFFIRRLCFLTSHILLIKSDRPYLAMQSNVGKWTIIKTYLFRNKKTSEVGWIFKKIKSQIQFVLLSNWFARHSFTFALVPFCHVLTPLKPGAWQPNTNCHHFKLINSKPLCCDVSRKGFFMPVLCFVMAILEVEATIGNVTP